MKYTSLHVLIGAFFFSLLNIITVVALESGAHVLTLIAVRSITVVVLLALFLRLSGIGLGLAARERNVACVIGAIASVHSFTIASAIFLMPVALAILVFYTYPVITSVATWVLGRRRPGARSVLALILALAGVALALEVDFGAYNTAGLAYAALSAVTWSVMLMLSARYFRGADPRVQTFYMQVALLAFIVTATLATGKVEFPQTGLGWSALTGVPFAYITGMLLLLTAASHIGAMKAAFYMNSEPIITIVLSMLLLGQRLSPIQMLGAAMVVVSLFLFRPLRAEPLQAQA